MFAIEELQIDNSLNHLFSFYCYCSFRKHKVASSWGFEVLTKSLKSLYYLYSYLFWFSLEQEHISFEIFQNIITFFYFWQNFWRILKYTLIKLSLGWLIHPIIIFHLISIHFHSDSQILSFLSLIPSKHLLIICTFPIFLSPILPFERSFVVASHCHDVVPWTHAGSLPLGCQSLIATMDLSGSVLTATDDHRLAKQPAGQSNEPSRASLVLTQAYGMWEALQLISTMFKLLFQTSAKWSSMLSPTHMLVLPTQSLSNVPCSSCHCVCHPRIVSHLLVDTNIGCQENKGNN